VGNSNKMQARPTFLLPRFFPAYPPNDTVENNYYKLVIIFKHSFKIFKATRNNST